ncbi:MULTISPECIES: cyclic peptide export ABC transporter [unclassified Colwellia]|uniref:cyclic peptide export ABC transporter n=1 Tax=unclassified Colwellia TaxID=196834 RepID=UPI0015F436E0|nr:MULTISPECIES: cyclic peptide export ABC transporter [unclassified Colwellia]MBA6257668.1 cyclic peptide export ABC transporter [Colwellia sp. MB3u-28]MBA6259425.1 cyclic peptide export ABC transporter [Colwellia sp. MB3u-41]MBA6304372.1 cyclic peptide export ABC transporter [Colwellia sp. MB02u-14]
MFNNMLGKYKGLIALSALASALTAFAGVFLMLQIRNEVTLETTQSILERVQIYGLGVLGLLFFGLLSQYLLARLSTSMVCKLRNSMVNRVLATSYEQLERIGGHRIQATITNDISSISSAMTLVPMFTFHLTMVVLSFFYLFYLSPGHFFLLASFLTAAITVAQFIINKVGDKYKELRESEDVLFENFKALVDGGKELSLNQSRKNYFYKNVTMPATKEIQNQDLKAQLYWSLNNNWTSAMLFLTLGVIAFSASMFESASIGDIVGYVFIITYLVGPINFLMNTFMPISKGKIAFNKIESLNLAPEYTHEDGSQVNEPRNEKQWNKIEVKDLEYKYESEDGAYEFSVGPINLNFNQGETVFIIGGNGSGKSTFAKLFTSLYTADKGSIQVDGKALTTENSQWYRDYFTTIFSDYYLFSEVLDSKGELAVDEDILKHLENLGLSDKVTVSGGVLKTTKLSMGQKKRLALLLAYMEDSPIYLFDEWAADQDPYFRHYFYTELLAEMKSNGKTVIAITHDDRYFNLADKVIKFENGQAAEVGKTDELFAEPLKASA